MAGSGGILLSEDDANRDNYPNVVTSPSIFIHAQPDMHQVNVTNLQAKSSC